MKLFLMRHGQADSSQVDPGLSEQGQNDIETLARRLAGQGITFSQVFHSKKARAQQTAEIMSRVLAPNIKVQMRSGLKPNDDPNRLLADIESWQQDTLVTSHLPFVPGLLAVLTGESLGMSIVPGTVICLARKNDRWKIEWIESP